MYIYMYAYMYTHIITQVSSISHCFFVTHTISASCCYLSPLQPSTPLPVYLLVTWYRTALLHLPLRASLFCVAVAGFADSGFISVVVASRAVFVAVRVRAL